MTSNRRYITKVKISNCHNKVRHIRKDISHKTSGFVSSAYEML